MTDTIFALSSGSPPAAIAVVRVSGPAAFEACERLCGSVPQRRHASLRTLRDGEREVLDQALVLAFPGPASATGEDCAEFHCHGGRAVVAAVCGALAAIPGLRAAEPGEFTRRAFANGRIDLAEAEALGDLLAAETELQRRVAQGGVGGALSRQVDSWRDEILTLSAMVEAVLDFSDEDDVASLPAEFLLRIEQVRSAIAEVLSRPRTERLRDGVRVVLGGPPNTGKSSLFNALVRDGAAIVSAQAGTTRDVIERPVSLGGVPFVLIDTAGLRDEEGEDIEAIGIAKARAQIEQSDIVLWLGAQGEGPAAAIEVQARCDDSRAPAKRAPDHIVSSVTGEGLAKLEADLIERARWLLPKPGDAAINARQADRLERAAIALSESDDGRDPLLLAERLRIVRGHFDALLGRSGVEDMLDTLFGRFCIGK